MTTNPQEAIDRHKAELLSKLHAGTPIEGDGGCEPGGFPDFEVEESDAEVIVRAEMPGFNGDEIDLQVSGNVLTIQAETRHTVEGLGTYRAFNQRVELPAGVGMSGGQATYINGVLELHLPRRG